MGDPGSEATSDNSGMLKQDSASCCSWINLAIRDHKDGEVGKVGCEINFNPHFYKYTRPRPLEEIEADIKADEKDILEMLREVAD
jgi:type I restriction enzyme M protein